MNFSFKTILVLSLFTSLTCTVFAASKPYIVKKGGSKAYYDHISADKRGVLILKKGSVTKKINPGAYIYAQVPMPAEIKKATSVFKAKKYSDAAAIFEKCYSKYKFVGWDVYCAYVGGKSFSGAGNKDAAIALLTKITKRPVNPSSRRYYMPLRKLLVTKYVETANASKAEKILKTLLDSDDDATVAFAYNQYGDLLMKQGKIKDAKLMYLSTALLFDAKNKKERPEALLKIIKLLRSEKNNKALEFEKKLRTDYPGTHYLKDL